MIPNFDENLEFKNLIKDKQTQIILRTSSKILEHENFKKVHRLIISFKEERIINDFVAICIKQDEIENIADDIQEKLFATLSSETAIVNNHLFVDRNFSLLHQERKLIIDNNEARRLYLELSKDYCVFLITPKGVHYFVEGNDIGEAIFFTSAALNSYNELKDISKLAEIFDEYKQHLKLLDTYRKFFVTASAKKSLYAHLFQAGEIKLSEEDFLNRYTQLLNNKPEDSFQDDLRHFLESKLKANFLTKEYIMNNFRRLDIIIQDDFGELYLIEVKWVGLSIHRGGQKIGSSFTSNDINPDAVIQSIDYIRQLADENKSIKIGYLVVFDARDVDLPDTVEILDENSIKGNNKQYYSRFKKVSDFRVKNLQPNLV